MHLVEELTMKRNASSVTGLNPFLNEFLAVSEGGDVVRDQVGRSRWGRTTLGADREVAAVVRPCDREEVVEVVKLAGKYGVGLYPVSTGRNWGYGAARPVAEDSVVIDLSALAEIEDFDARLGVVTVGPGVTQAALTEFLDGAGGVWMTPVTGAGPATSILGNALERGYGITPESDHFLAVQSLEVLLADGSTVRSGLHAAGANTVDGLFKWGLGPYLDGLFTQSGMGIVTRATISLARRPGKVMTFVGKVKREAGLAEAVEAVRDVLATYPGLVGGVNLMNRRRVLAMAERPSAETLSIGRPVSDAELTTMAKRHRVSHWTVMGAIYGEPAAVRVASTGVKMRLRRGKVPTMRLTEARTGAIRRVLSCLPGGLAKSLDNQLQQLEQAQRILRGRPSEVALPLAYWRRAEPAGVPNGDGPNAGGSAAPGLDPARDGCGLIWYSPLIPMTGEDAERFVATTTQTCLESGFDPLITLTSLSPRVFDCTVPILFDAAKAGEADRAQACYRLLFDRNARDGYVPYRLPVTEMGRVIDCAGDAAYWRVVHQLKLALDPGGIMSPGRYAPVRPPSGSK